MSTLVTIGASDSISTSRSDINNNFSALNTDKIETSVIDTDTTLAANSDSKIASQKAVKAYVDAAGSIDTGLKQGLNAGATINGASTPVPVYQNKTDNEVYACDGNDLTKLKFIGFAVTNGTDGNSIDVKLAGVVEGFTGLSEGEKYYLSDTAGSISSTPGTYEVLVGIAISETALVIQKGKRYAAGNVGTLGTSSGSSAITIGFRPSIIRIYASATDTNFVSVLTAVFTPSTFAAGAVTLYNEGTAGLSENTARVYSTDTANYMTISISNVTDTGFTIVWTETMSFAPGTSNLSWEAEGDL